MNTKYFLNQIMGNVFKTKTSPALPTAYYIGLSSKAPNVDGGNVAEPSASGTGYKRIQLTSLSAPADGVIVNNEAITFDESSTSWGTMTHYVVYDALTGGNLLFYGALSNSRNVEPNTIIMIRAKEMTIELTNAT